jgi:hypothetical protein
MPAMRVACLLLLALASGCNHVQLSGGALYVQSGPALGAILAAAVLAANVDARSGSSPGMGPVPEMLADRTIAEQDCTQPIEDWSANLKCR